MQDDNRERQINALLKKYQGLSFNKDALILKGVINIDDKSEDSYEVKIDLRPFPKQFPKVYEGGRIPPKADRHVNLDNTLCFTTPAIEQVLIKKQIRNLTDFVDRILVPYLRNNSFFEINKRYKYGDYAHGLLGRLDGYRDILKIDNYALLLKLLIKRSKNKKFKRNEPCFCGSGKKIKDCHLYRYNDLFIIDDNLIQQDITATLKAIQKINESDVPS